MLNKIKKLIKSRYTPEQIKRLCLAAFIFIAAWLVWGCGKAATVTEYYPVYREVKIPVPCHVPRPEKPSYEGDTVIDNLNILQYAEELETALAACTEGTE